MQPAAGSSSFHQLCFQQRPHLARLLQQLSVLALVQTAGANGELPLLADYNCRQLKTMDATHNSESACYCYIPHGVIHLKNIWSTIQVKINSTEMFKVMSIPEEHNCQNYEHLFAFLKCLINSIWQSDVSNETIISVGQYGDKTCFRVQPRNNVLYTVTAHQNILDRKRFLLFVAGGLLFHFAHNLSRSTVFYYSAGVTFGVLATLVFLLLMLKRFIPKLSTFWILMSGFWFSSLYFFYTLKEDLKWLWHNYTHYILGYCLIVGFVSFAICYKHGPLNSEQSMNLLMWMLQVTGLVFIYIGIAIPEVAYAVIVAMVCSKILHYPLRVFCYVGRKANQLFKSEKIEIRYLTEDEYREQSETETVKALEELRTFCRSPNFPSWIAVVKLQSPQKFANFVLGLPHVSPEETTAHEEQYGIGGALLEQQLFNLESEAESDHQTIPFQEEENSEEEEHRQQQNTVHFHSRELF
ncbi:nuclear envelope integral membrane protein 2 isoform X2 [Rhineura floridana]|uniref:nuclear envelope integral membrane protein 2 isoform X2 n=1 Tax=Rhineura floridana TaxID=261503 RepID=UPI002AC7FC9D|nr:nuclear envelope integral membrane protein 2 isoform X2 [Rhineura floridana]